MKTFTTKYKDRKIDSQSLKKYYDAEALQTKSKKDSMYGKQSWFQNKLWKERMLAIQKYSPRSRFLDIGCAEGYLIDTVEGLLGSLVYYVGLDISEVYLKRAKEKVGAVVLANAESLPFRNASFDLILMSEVMEHCPNPYTAFREALRVTSKFLIVTTPQRSLLRRILDLFNFSKDTFDKRAGHISEISFGDILGWSKHSHAQIIDKRWDCYLPNGIINFFQVG